VPAGHEEEKRSYWRKNLTLVGWLLAVWFAVSFGCGILLADRLNAVTIPGTGFKLGFWFAQQGSIYVFLLLIAIYVVAMNRLDRRYHVEEKPGQYAGEGEDAGGSGI
jgi:putative solute:sodium symporter small subunit